MALTFPDLVSRSSKALAHLIGEELESPIEPFEGEMVHE